MHDDACECTLMRAHALAGDATANTFPQSRTPVHTDTLTHTHTHMYTHMYILMHAYTHMYTTRATTSYYYGSSYGTQGQRIEVVF